MALTKQRKDEVLATYQDWLKRSQAVILVEYTGAKMKDMDNIRAKVRESGGEFHVVKNTLARRAFADHGMTLSEESSSNPRLSRLLLRILPRLPRRFQTRPKVWSSSRSRAVSWLVSH